MSTPLQQLLHALQQQADPAFAKGLQRFGIPSGTRAFGVRLPVLRQLARPHRNDHALALALWEQPHHETKILATLVEDHTQITRPQADDWAVQLYSWDLCDQWCTNVLYKSDLTPTLIVEYAQREEEFARRGAFVLIAVLAVKAKKLPDAQLLPYLDLIQAHVYDDRIYVKKAVNWALRNLGKNRPSLLPEVKILAQALAEDAHATARWIGKDALRDLKRHAERQANRRK